VKKQYRRTASGGTSDPSSISRKENVKSKAKTETGTKIFGVLSLKQRGTKRSPPSRTARKPNVPVWHKKRGKEGFRPETRTQTAPRKSCQTINSKGVPKSRRILSLLGGMVQGGTSTGGPYKGRSHLQSVEQNLF